MSEKIYNASLLVIGNEILSGRTQDANTAWIGERLSTRGVSLREVRIVPDVEEEIIAGVNALRDKYDYVLTTGGIGPTHDDITAASVAKAFGVPLMLDEQAYQALVAHYGSEEEVTAPRRKMAMVPQGATLILNPVSGAPGFQMENLFVMAGIPRIMQAMFDDVQGRMGQGLPILSNTVSCTLAESVVAEALGGIQGKYPQIDIGSYPHFRGGLLGLNLVLRGTDSMLLDKATGDVIAMISALGGEASALSIQSGGV